MQSKAKTVDAFMVDVPVERIPAIAEIRRLALEILDGYTESMTYGMPCYVNGEAVAVAFNSQKNYIAVYFPPPVVEANKALLKGVDCGKSCLRYPKPDKINFEVIATLLKAVYESNAKI